MLKQYLILQSVSLSVYRFVVWFVKLLYTNTDKYKVFMPNCSVLLIISCKFCGEINNCKGKDSSLISAIFFYDQFVFSRTTLCKVYIKYQSKLAIISPLTPTTDTKVTSFLLTSSLSLYMSETTSRQNILIAFLFTESQDSACFCLCIMKSNKFKLLAQPTCF